MNILYLIGNGFDCAQGAETRYEDFYRKAYKESEPVNDVEAKIISSIKEDTKTWADMEVALGGFTQEIDSADEFEEAYVSLSDKLQAYLLSENTKVHIKSGQSVEDLLRPDKGLTDLDKSRFAQRMSIFGAAERSIDVVSFNYTDILERCLNYRGAREQLSIKNGSVKYYLNSVHKIHGQLNGTILLGVNDKEQILNKEFADNPAVTDFLIKPLVNEHIGRMNDRILMNQITNADLIVTFGMSIGATDRFWWQKICNRLLTSGNSFLVIYKYSTEDLSKRAWKIDRIRRDVKTQLSKLSGLSSGQFSGVEPRIYVAVDNWMFNPNVIEYKGN